MRSTSSCTHADKARIVTACATQSVMRKRRAHFLPPHFGTGKWIASGCAFTQRLQHYSMELS